MTSSPVFSWWASWSSDFLVVQAIKSTHFHNWLDGTCAGNPLNKIHPLPSHSCSVTWQTLNVTQRHLNLHVSRWTHNAYTSSYNNIWLYTYITYIYMYDIHTHIYICGISIIYIYIYMWHINYILFRIHSILLHIYNMTYIYIYICIIYICGISIIHICDI